MNESFELLCSMSPKVKGRQKTLKKAITVLALKKHFRRSSIYDKATPVDNEDLAVVEAGTTESSGTKSKSSSNFSNSKDPKERKVKPIIIIDSSSEADSPARNTNKLSKKLLANTAGPVSKVNRIQEWLDSIDLANDNCENVTFFSQVSTIYGDDAPKFNPEGNGIAASSTFNEFLTQRFDECFKGNKAKTKFSDESFDLERNTSLQTKLQENGTKESNISSKNTSDTSKNSSYKSCTENKFELSPANITRNIIDETLISSDDSFKKMPENRKIEKTPERLDVNTEVFVTIRKKPNEKSHVNSQDDEVESMLDSLYGEKWREKHTHVLPMSEPKKANTIINRIVEPITERNIKPSMTGNILKNIDYNQKKLNLAQLKKPISSPWVQKLKGLCDSDSDNCSENNNIKIKKIKDMNHVKARLNFCDDSPITGNAKKDIENKANIDDSYWGDSLEERIRKKMSRVKVPITNTKKQSTKKSKVKSKSTSDKENQHKPTVQISGKKLNDNNANPDSTKTKNNKLRNKTERERSSGSSNTCSDVDISSDEEYDKEITRMVEVRRRSVRPKDKVYSFLESLSAHVPITKCHILARTFRTSFKHNREELTKKLFALYNEKIFEKAIPSDAEIQWNDKLRNTAGMCYCKKISQRNGNIERKVRIALSSKVLDSPDRLRDTLVHEMCHAATWIVNMVSNGHGDYWKAWAFKAMKVFPELPPIKRCHSYTINTKYTYKCTKCGYSFGRHSKSLDTERKRCGHCFGKFEVLINKTTKNGETKSIPITPRKEATGFALFVKENYAQYKEPSRKHGDVMKILGQRFAELKVKSSVA